MDSIRKQFNQSSYSFTYPTEPNKPSEMLNISITTIQNDQESQLRHFLPTALTKRLKTWLNKGGFHHMDPDEQREIASKGGKTSSGSFEPGETRAREASRKG